MGVSSAKSGKISRIFMEALASAVREWLLLFLLLLNAIIAYLVTKFARCCGLQTPCLLCSRLDHILGNEKSGYYWDMICGTHKLEISALAICHAHTSRGHVHDAMKIIGGGCFDHMINPGIGSLPHIGYTELKATSDTESDVFMFSDDDGTGVLVPGRDGHVSLDFATLETEVLVSNEQVDSRRDSVASSPSLSQAKVGADEDQDVGNMESSGVEIGLKEMNLWGPEINNDSAFVDELVFFEDLRSLETRAAETNKSAEMDEVIEKAETDSISSPEKSTEEKVISTETSQEVASISNDRESRELDSESPSQDPVIIESSPKANTLSPRVSFHDTVMNESSCQKPEEVTILNSSSSNELDNIEQNETNESDLSMDGGMEMLMKQIEDDRQALQELQRELEEERNAAAIAANEAMAMITRLQDEKANLYMEAQQYLRLMEEQAEYDMEALQKSNDLLVEREMEIQDLEDELESYRINEPLPENINDSLLYIEDERLHLEQCLKKLGEKLRVRVSSENPNLSNSLCHEDSPDKDSSSVSKGINVDSLAKEVSDLQERLEKLETDRVFIERAIKYLRIGDEGLLFIQDLASHLQELRNNQLRIEWNNRVE